LKPAAEAAKARGGDRPVDSITNEGMGRYPFIRSVHLKPPQTCIFGYLEGFAGKMQTINPQRLLSDNSFQLFLM